MQEEHGADAVLREGDLVSFQIKDVYLPGSRELLARLNGEADLEGTLLQFSDSGPTPRFFAVVEVRHDQKVIVPVTRLRQIRTIQDGS